MSARAIMGQRFPKGCQHFLSEPFQMMAIDPFMGSGTTMIAAHRNNRIGYGIEKGAKYVELIIRRFVDAFGEEKKVDFEHLNGGLTP